MLNRFGEAFGEADDKGNPNAERSNDTECVIEFSDCFDCIKNHLLETYDLCDDILFPNSIKLIFHQTILS